MFNKVAFINNKNVQKTLLYVKFKLHLHYKVTNNT